MSEALLAGAVLMAFLGCACLALSQERHWTVSTGKPPISELAQRNAGLLLLAGSLGLSVARDGFTFAILFWPLIVGVGAIATSATLTWRPWLLRPLALLFNRA
ncbi:DUF3325 family protein [Erythrobacter sp. QSSC1-22B]|uniref:DUF3325 family protein n=1 Tax=Erythrobacter sp. QSSC1-22B TaxID=1860125 RepID=UPI0009F68030